MEERVTVTVESGLEPERKAALGRAVAEAFGLSEAEGQALLAADALVLAPAEARELAVLGQQLGIAVSLASAPLRRPWQRGRWLAGAALLAVVAVVAAALSVRGPGSSAPAAAGHS